jgi:hypothetical protein
MAGIRDCTVSFKRWQKLIISRILKAARALVSAGASTVMAVSFASLDIPEPAYHCPRLSQMRRVPFHFIISRNDSVF